jgi:hypothetical protein
MNGTSPWKRLAFAVIALTCFLRLGVATAQETWGDGGSGVSSWQAGSTTSAASARSAAGSGGSSSWSAGKGSFTPSRQQGGVWRDGSALPTIVRKNPAAGLAASTFPVNKPAAVTSLKPLPASVHKAVLPGKAQSFRGPAGPHSSQGIHFGAKNGARGGTLKTSKSGAFSSSSRSQQGTRSAGITGWKTSPASGSTPAPANPGDSLH